LTKHALIELIKYKWHAKTRHGIHSPFVYDFVESLIYKKQAPPPAAADLCCRNELLLTKIVHHYNCKTIGCFTNETEIANAIPKQYDLIWLNTDMAENWNPLFTRISPLLHADSIIAIPDIHKTEKHSAAWKMLYGDARVKLSMDLYRTGLLFFKGDFKQKQHFILKYP
jgi:hypothetical protein